MKKKMLTYYDLPCLMKEYTRWFSIFRIYFRSKKGNKSH